MQLDQRASKADAMLPLLFGSIVLTQNVYIAKSALEIEIASTAIWSVETLLFLAIAVLGLVAMLQRTSLAPAMAGIALGGLVNMLQVGMGLTLFAPLSNAGDAMAPVYDSVVAMAFFLFFSGKLLFGFAAFVIGTHLSRHGGPVRFVGLSAIISGIVAMLVNTGGIALGMDWLYPAGATGTIATALLALALHVESRGALQTAG